MALMCSAMSSVAGVAATSIACASLTRPGALAMTRYRPGVKIGEDELAVGVGARAQRRGRRTR